MRSIRSRTTLVATAALAVALAACGTSAGGAPAGATAAPVAGAIGGSITVWTWDGAPGADAMTALAAGFKAETGVSVDSRVISRDDYKAQAQLALNSGEKIDVLGVQPSQFATEVKGSLRPVSSYSSSLAKGMEGYSPDSRAQLDRLYGGAEAYSVPFASTGSAVCYYNGDLLAKAAVEPPRTWADVATLAQKLKAVAPDALPLVMPSGSTDSWFPDEFVLTMVGQDDPGFFNALRYDGAPLNTASYVKGLSRFGALYADGTLPRAALDLGYDDAMKAFTTGKAAIACNGTWEAGMLSSAYRAKNGIAINRIGVIPVPADDPATRSARAFLDITWGIPTAAPNPAAAAAFISYATQGNGVKLWSGGLGFVPALADWTLDPAVLADDPVAQEGFAQILSLVRNPSSDRNNLSSLSTQIGTYDIEVAQGRMSAQDAADKAQADHTSGLYG